jgi:large subunit ribosomal protein L21
MGFFLFTLVRAIIRTVRVQVTRTMFHQRRVLERNICSASNSLLRYVAVQQRTLRSSTSSELKIAASDPIGAVNRLYCNNNSQQVHKQNRLYVTISRQCLLPYAAVDHSTAYVKALDGPHGKQLSLADIEGIGKDDPPFDPFIEEELEEERLLALAAKGTKIDVTKGNTVDDGVGDDDDNEDDDSLEGDDDVEIEENDWRVLYNSDGSLKRNKSEKKILAAGSPAGGLFAIIELAGSQYKVTTDDLLIVNRLKPVTDYKIGSIHTLTGPQVLLLGSSHYTLVGMPSIEHAEVDIMIEEITKDEKIVIFSKRRRKNSKRKNGFRRDVTMLRILDIRPPQEHAQKTFIQRPDPAPLVVAQY